VANTNNNGDKGGNSFTLLKNSNLACKDCIYVYEPDERCLDCAIFNSKPTVVLDGGECDQKVKNNF
jgi:hypothetical protein